jgi:ribosomal protein L37AE/L43A
MTKRGQKIVVVTVIEKLKRNDQPCRYCGHVFTHPNYCCVEGIDHCPKCGCPVAVPAWAQKVAHAHCN